MATATKRKIQLHISGSSFGCTYGPMDQFDFIPLLLLDNAVKYAPPASHIYVTFKEPGKTIDVLVESVGPRLKPGEAEAIFASDFRGAFARQAGKAGTGIGLSVVKTFVEQHYGGSIKVIAGGFRQNVNAVPYDDIAFALSFPKTSEAPIIRQSLQPLLPRL